MSRTLCTNCKRIYTNNDRCVHCQNVDPEKMFPSRIAVVYPEGSLLQKLAVHAFNHLATTINEQPLVADVLAREFGVSESEIYEAVEILHTEN